jgi:ABC-type glycerol-3-phosphate transport system permease component
MAASVVFILPVTVVFLLAQRFFIQGIALSGMKA